MSNTAAPVSLILLGSQAIWAPSELIRRATDPSTPSIENVGIERRRHKSPFSVVLSIGCVPRRRGTERTAAPQLA